MANNRKNIEENIKKLALKYYGTDKLSSLQPYQLDKLVTWNTGRTVDYGKNQSRKAEMALRQNKKFRNKRRHEHNENNLYGNKEIST